LRSQAFVVTINLVADIDIEDIEFVGLKVFERQFVGQVMSRYVTD
jgi:hypothetical protein